MFQDLLLAVRSFFRRPGLLLVSAFTFALGAGAVTTIFSVADTVLWRPLPYERPEQLVRLAGTWPRGGMATLAPPMFFDWQRQSRSFSWLAAVHTQDMDLRGEGEPRRFKGGAVSAEFLPLLGLEPALGRWFRESEDEPSAPRTVVLSHHAWRSQWGADPAIIGQQLTLNGQPYTVIGVMGADFHPPQGLVGVIPDFKQQRLGQPSQPEVYVPYTQPRFIFPYMDFVVRSSLEPQMLASSLRSAVWSVDSYQPVDWIAPLEERVSLSLAQPRFYALLLSLFAGLALILAAVGIYGTLSFWVNQRTCELAIRMALGATQRHLAAGVLGHGLALVLIGTAIGLAVSSLASRTLSGFLYGISATDGMTFAAVSLFLVLVAAAAMYLPARRAMQVDPIKNLRA